MTLACKNANSKLVEAVTVADVADNDQGIDSYGDDDDDEFSHDTDVWLRFGG